jgi:hypothetical protein
MTDLQKELECVTVSGIEAVERAGVLGVTPIFEVCDICRGKSLFEPEPDSCPCCGGLGGFKWVQFPDGRIVSQSTFDLAMLYSTISI